MTCSGYELYSKTKNAIILAIRGWKSLTHYV